MPHRQRMRDTPGHYASVPWGMVAHPWPGLGNAKKMSRCHESATQISMSRASIIDLFSLYDSVLRCGVSRRKVCFPSAVLILF